MAATPAVALSSAPQRRRLKVRKKTFVLVHGT
jgi:hypothetical protein